MKNYKNFLITEDSDDLILDDVNKVIIQEKTYDEIIQITEIDNLEISNETDKFKFSHTEYINMFRKDKSLFNNGKFKFLIAIKNKKLVGLFYKELGLPKDKYGEGYIFCLKSEKGIANKMFMEMQKLGSYTTFANAENIGSIKSQLKIDAEIIALSNTPPNKGTGVYTPSITDEKILKLIQDEKIYYTDTYTNENYYFMDKNDEIKLNGLVNYLASNANVKLISPDNMKNNTGLKIYFFIKQK